MFISSPTQKTCWILTCPGEVSSCIHLYTKSLNCCFAVPTNSFLDLISPAGFKSGITLQRFRSCRCSRTGEFQKTRQNLVAGSLVKDYGWTVIPWHLLYHSLVFVDTRDCGRPIEAIRILV